MTRTLPHSLEAEAAVLGGILLTSGKALDQVAGLVRPDDMYKPAHQRILTAALELHGRGEPVDVITLESALGDKLQQAGGLSGLSDLSGATPTAANIGHHARIVRDRAALRRLIRTCEELAADAYEAQHPDDLVQDGIRRLGRCFCAETGGRSVSEVVESVITEAERLMGLPDDARQTTRGIPTGMGELDDTLTYGGLPTGLVTTLGAATSKGKSALAKDIALNAALRNHRVLYCTFEDRAESPVARMLAALARVPSADILAGRIPSEKWTRLMVAAGDVARASIHFFEETPRTVRELVARIRRRVVESGTTLLIVDYLQLIKSGERKWSRQEEVDSVFGELVGLAHDLPDTATLVVSQLSRTGNARPTVENMYHSGMIEQGSHTILLLWAPETRGDFNCRALDVAKQKEGPTKLLVLGWDGPRVSFGTPDMAEADRYRDVLQKIMSAPPRRK